MPNMQQVIVVQRLETIATIKADEFGSDPIVVAAFKAAGSYLNEVAQDGILPDQVQFDYEGITFYASAGKVREGGN